MKIIGKAKIGEKNISCTGDIKIIHKYGNQAYVSWSMFDTTNYLRVASSTRKYFFEKEDMNEKEIADLVAKKILKYRIGRNYIFSEIILLDRDENVTVYRKEN